MVFYFKYQCGSTDLYASAAQEHFEVGCPSWHHHSPPGIEHGPLDWTTHALPIAPRPLPSVVLVIVIIICISKTTSIEL